MLADMLGDMPLGEFLSDQQVAHLCVAMVARATEGRSHTARR